MKLINNFSKLLRINQWVKNSIIFLPAFFAGELFNPVHFIELLKSFFAFSFITSSIYILNDALDVDEDRHHPIKKLRPIASGKIDLKYAFLIGIGLCILGLFYFYGIENRAFRFVLIYLGIMIVYCFTLRRIAILDVVIIAIGFVLRLFIGGEVAITPNSFWILIMVFLLALFIAMAKRRDDLINGNGFGRESIRNYNLPFIDSAISVLVPVIIVSYILYCTSDANILRVGDNLFVTTLFVILGFLRYLQLIFVKKLGGDPIQLFFTDIGLQISIIGWVSAFGYLLYF